MRLKTKVILILFSLFLTFGVIQFIAQKTFISPSFMKLEQEEAKTNLSRISAKAA